MTALALRNPIAVLMLCLGLCVFAVVVTPRMSVDTFPELTPPVLVIGTQAPGLGPRDVEKTISWRLEKYVSATPGVDHVESVSRTGFSIVYVWMKWGTNLNAAQTMVQQNAAFAMAAIPKSLGVLPPFVLQYDPSNAPVVQVVVSGGGLTGPQLYDYAFNYIEPVLEGIPGVASAAVDGGRMRQINVLVDPVKAAARGVTSTDVAAAVAQANALLPSGELITRGFDANVYTNAVPRATARIGDSLVKKSGDRPVLIKDVARVEDGGTPHTQSVFVCRAGAETESDDGDKRARIADSSRSEPGDARPATCSGAVALSVLRIPGGNTIDIVDAVARAVASLPNLPPGLHVEARFDQSVFVRGAYHGLRTEVAQALVLIAIVILVFLQSTRGTLIVSVAIPLSFAVTLIVLYAAGHTLNAFTLGGLTLAMGRLVDDAVVVLESIHRHERQGMSIADAALAGANAVALPVLASTLTTMAVLLPVVLLAGLAQRLFVPLALTVAVAMTASYFVSLGVTPVACRYLLRRHEPAGLALRVEHAIDRLADGYSRALRRVLPHRAVVLVSAAALVVASGVVAARLPSTFFPDSDEGMETIYVRFPPGTSIERSSSLLAEMARTLLSELPRGGAELVLGNVGSPVNARAILTSPNWGPHMGFLRVQLHDAEHRDESQQELADRSRAILERAFPGVELVVQPGGLVASVFLSGQLSPLVIEVPGDSLEAIDERAQAVASVMRTVAGVRDVRETLQLDYPEVHVDVARTEAGLVGVSARDVGQSTLEATLGNLNTPSVWIDGNNGQSYYVVTSYAGAEGPGAMRELPVRVSSSGRPVLLGAYAEVRRAVGPIAVERDRLRRTARLVATVEGRDLGGVANDLDAALARDPRTRSIERSFVGQVALLRTTFSGLGLALGLAVMVVFMIMASQFHSLVLPFVMLFTIPVALVGIVCALLAAGQGLSITALMGVLLVIGIAVSNGILLVDDAARRRRDGAAAIEAIIAAARSRFVPILMTSLATVIGLLPTALGLEPGTESNQPLALAVVGGLTSSTFLSLFLVPVIYLLVTRVPAGHSASPATLDPSLQGGSP